MSRDEFNPNGRACYVVTSKYRKAFRRECEGVARITRKRVEMGDGFKFERNCYGHEVASRETRVFSSYRRRLLWYQPEGGERVDVPGVATLPKP